MPEQASRSTTDLTPDQKRTALRTGLAAHLGILLGAAITLLGGMVGAISGKILKKNSASKGFSIGAIIAGGVTSAIQLVNWSRIGSAASQLPKEVERTKMEKSGLVDSAMLERTLVGKCHTETLEQSRREQTGLLRSR